jgi:hypothetical protein
LARFTSADPTVTDPLNPQGWNRYSYVGNDPLAFTDPNGFSWLSQAFHSITNFIRNNPIVRAIVQIASTIILNAVLPGLGFVAGSLGLAAAAAAGGAIIATGLSGGNLGQILRAGLIAGATAAAFFEVGDLTLGPAHASPAFDSPDFNAGNFAANVGGHALVGCGSAVASGGSCGSGALSGALGAAAAPALTDLNFGGRLVVSATLGGIGSVAGGGKFANGAVTAAFGYLFNQIGRDNGESGRVGPPPGQLVVDQNDDLRIRISFLQAEPDPRLGFQNDTDHYGAWWKISDAIERGALFILPPTDTLPTRYLLQLQDRQIGRDGSVNQGVYEYIVHPSDAGQSPTLTHSVFIKDKVVNGYPNRDGP